MTRKQVRKLYVALVVTLAVSNAIFDWARNGALYMLTLAACLAVWVIEKLRSP
jgi:isoprenylcysteine carboxyl methyltransferase (ICMT) family protein YpbQ